MTPDYILLRFGELTLKGKNRHLFEQKVVSQIRARLASFSRISVQKTFGRVYIRLNGEPYMPIVNELKKIFGLFSFSPVLKADLDVASMQQTAFKVMQELPSVPRTFKVSVRRAYKDFPLNSLELNHQIGGYILRHMPDLRVDVHQPDTELHVEVRQEGVFIFSEVIPGLGGFPVGTNGKAMLMLSGGIDSPVAGWLAMKRGVEIEAVHFHSFPYTSERAQLKVIDLARKLANYTKEIKLHMVPFTEIQMKLRQHGRENLLVTLMRRAMFRITENIAFQQKAKAIVTGENLGQVASQTLSSLYVIGRVTELPILQPLIAMDKREIIDIAEKIETYPISILPYEDCCTLFVPKSPSTNPNLQTVEKLESRMPWLPEEIESAVQRTEVMTITASDHQAEDDLF